MVDIEYVQCVVREAGEYILGNRDTRSTEKTNSKDFVTVSDIKSQDILRHGLARNYPDIAILSEEDPEPEREQLHKPGFTGFVLDPIDGTYNFKRDMRESAVSVGYIEAGEPLLGVIYDPYKNEMYTAEQGKGSWCNGEPIHVSTIDRLDNASITTSNSYDSEAMARNLRRHLAIYEQTGMMPWTNCAGSGVLIMAHVARGRFDIYHHNGLKPWDNAVGFLLVREAGGVVETLTGEPAHFTSSTVLMGAPEIVRQLRSVYGAIDHNLLT